MSILTRAAAAAAIAVACAWAGPAQADERLAGVALRHGPSHDGAAAFEVGAVPLLRVAHGSWFARTTHGVPEAGARRRIAPGLVAGVQGAYEAGRLGEEPGLSLGAHLEWNARIGPAPVAALARARKRASAADGGALDLRLSAGVYQSGRLRVGAWAQATWADAGYQRADYNVRESGLLAGAIGVGAAWDLGPDLLALAGAELRRLGGGPARSEFVDERAAAVVTAGLAYRF